MSEFETKVIALLEEIAANTKPAPSATERIKGYLKEDAEIAKQRIANRTLSYVTEGFADKPKN